MQSKGSYHKGQVLITPENPDDMWVVLTILQPGDTIRSKTSRKIKSDDGPDVKTQVRKIWVTLTIVVEKVELGNEGESIRVSGTVQQGTDDIPTGVHHTITIEENQSLSIEKQWLQYEIDMIQESINKQAASVLAVTLDREQACFGKLYNKGFRVTQELSGQVEKKDQPNQGKEDFFKSIATEIERIVQRENPQHIIIASPAFFKEYVIKHIGNTELSSKVVQATVSSAGPEALAELYKRPELKQVLAKERSSQEVAMMETLLEAIAKDEACYGTDDCKTQAEAGAIKLLVISQKFILKCRNEGSFETINNILQIADQTKAEIHVLSSDETQTKLIGLGGIAGVLRWKTS